MELTHSSSRRSLIFAARIILGIAVATGGAAIGGELAYGHGIGVLRAYSPGVGEDYLFLASEFLGGVVSGYILRRHFLWILPIPALIISALISLFPETFFGPFEGFSSAQMALIFLGVIGLPIYAGAALGYQISKIRRGQLQRSP